PRFRGSHQGHRIIGRQVRAEIPWTPECAAGVVAATFLVAVVDVRNLVLFRGERRSLTVEEQAQRRQRGARMDLVAVVDGCDRVGPRVLLGDRSLMGSKVQRWAQFQTEGAGTSDQAI